MINCASPNDIAVYQTINQDKGAYFGLLIVNWDDTESKSILLDFVALGIVTADS